jgi:HAD superfamily hydrolase (TIGR01490 family)
MSNFIMPHKYVPIKEADKEKENEVRKEIEKIMGAAPRIDLKEIIDGFGPSSGLRYKTTKMKAAFFDIDGTLVKGAMGVAFSDFLAKKGILNKKANDEMQALLSDYKAGKVKYKKFADRIPELHAAGLKGQKQSGIMELAREFMKEYSRNIMPYAKELVSLMNSRGYRTIAISGSPTEPVLTLKDYLDFKEVYATEKEVVDGIYTGRVKRKLGTLDAKYELVGSLVKKHNIDTTNSFAFGDTMQDYGLFVGAHRPYFLSPSSEASEVVQRVIKKMEELTKKSGENP